MGFLKEFVEDMTDIIRGAREETIEHIESVKEDAKDIVTGAEEEAARRFVAPKEGAAEEKGK